MAISDDDVRKVWRADCPSLSVPRFKQFLFVNLHLSHLETSFELGRLTKESVAAEIKLHLTNEF